MGRRSRAWSYGSTEELTQKAEVRALIDGHVQAANRKLERWETVKRWAFLPGELDVENGEVTPSMKVRRAEVEAPLPTTCSTRSTTATDGRRHPAPAAPGSSTPRRGAGVTSTRRAT